MAKRKFKCNNCGAFVEGHPIDCPHCGWAISYKKSLGKWSVIPGVFIGLLFQLLLGFIVRPNVSKLDFSSILKYPIVILIAALGYFIGGVITGYLATEEEMNPGVYTAAFMLLVNICIGAALPNFVK